MCFGHQALGLEVTVISTSPNKEKEARERLGADHFIVSKDDKAMAVRQSSTTGFTLCRCQCNAHAPALLLSGL